MAEAGGRAVAEALRAGAVGFGVGEGEGEGDGEGYGHFCGHFRPTGGRCTKCDKCDLYKDEDDDVLVRRAGEVAEREWRVREGMVGVKLGTGAVGTGSVGGAGTGFGIGMEGEDAGWWDWWRGWIVGWWNGEWGIQDVVDFVVGVLVEGTDG